MLSVANYFYGMKPEIRVLPHIQYTAGQKTGQQEGLKKNFPRGAEI
jgi:hypothetical protein